MFDTDTCPTIYQCEVLQADKMMEGYGPGRQKGNPKQRWEQRGRQTATRKGRTNN